MENKSAEGVADHRSEEFAPYPKIDPRDLEPPPPPVVASSTAAVQSEKEAAALSTATVQSEKEAAASSAANPYVLSAPPNSSVPKNKVESVRETLGRWGKKAAEATKATEDYTGSVWQHLKTAPNVADAAMGMIAQSTKVIAEGGYDKIFQSTFETLPDEQLKKSYRCYLSTSAGPVMGIMYLSSEKLAFCSDNALSYKVGDKTEWSFYKVMIPLNQLRTVNPSANKANASEKYIQVVSVDDHEFWFMGIVNYQDAVKSLQEVPRGPNLQP